jgi:hypothetical protein
MRPYCLECVYRNEWSEGGKKSRVSICVVREFQFTHVSDNMVCVCIMSVWQEKEKKKFVHGSLGLHLSCRYF